jgi:hypothetical protein
VDVRLDDVVLSTLEKEPRLRYQRASDLSQEVRSLSDVGSGPLPDRDRPRRRSETRRYDYRSKRTVWGVPLVHIAFARDPSGARMALAPGVIAIGDTAVGLIAIGGFAAGGVTIAGMSVGLVSLGGIAAGLLLAIGGVAFGLVATGAVSIAALDLPANTMRWVSLGAWGVLTLLVSGAVAGAIIWWKDLTEADTSEARRR